MNNGRQKDLKKEKDLTPEVQFILICSPTWYLGGMIVKCFNFKVGFPPVPRTNDTGTMSWNDNYK